MSFFILLAILLFVYGQKQKKYLLLSGLSIGLAMLTKYPGILPLFIIITYVALAERRNIKLKDIGLLCLTSIIVFLPWIIWNWKVYGNLMDAVISIHGHNSIVGRSLENLSEYKLMIAFLILMIGIVVWIRKKGFLQSNKAVKATGLILCVLLIIATPFLRGMFTEAFSWNETVLVGWSNPFSKGPWYFYLTRLSELSPVYLFSFLSVVLLIGRNRGDRLLLISSFMILGAFILLGNYQSRYILPAVPFLIILSARFQILMYDKLSQSDGDSMSVSNPGALKTLAKFLPCDSLSSLFDPPHGPPLVHNTIFFLLGLADGCKPIGHAIIDRLFLSPCIPCRELRVNRHRRCHKQEGKKQYQ